MRERLILPTAHPDIELRELADRSTDKALWELITVNRPHWQLYDPLVLRLHPNLLAIRRHRLIAPNIGEYRMGVWRDEQLVGWAALATFRDRPNPEHGNWIGYWMDRYETGKGYATAAAHALVGYARDNHHLARKITTEAQPTNVPSIRILQSLGFQQVAEQPTVYANNLVYRLLLDESPVQEPHKQHPPCAQS